jgi:hypothetical protein
VARSTYTKRTDLRAFFTALLLFHAQRLGSGATLRAMAELKTKPGDESVDAYLGAVDDPERRADCLALLALMRQATGQEPRLWGGSIVGFGSRHYKYASGREGDWFLVGFAPRRKELTLYFGDGLEAQQRSLATLGKHKTGKGCVYVKRLADVDLQVLHEMVARAARSRPAAALSSAPA